MPKGSNQVTDLVTYRPTEAEIAEKCREIRSSWPGGLQQTRGRPAKRTVGVIAERAYPSRVEIPGDEVI